LLIIPHQFQSGKLSPTGGWLSTEAGLSAAGRLLAAADPSTVVAAWLTALITPPATARYPAIVVIITGRLTGAVITTVLTAASVRPIFRNVLKKPGVGIDTLCKIFILFF
jgi:pheromone shutdown protein TraB